MAEIICKDNWQTIVDYLDLRSQLRLMSTCKMLAGLSIRHIAQDAYPRSNALMAFRALTQPKFAHLTSLSAYGHDGYIFRFDGLKLTKLSITGGFVFEVEKLTSLTALSMFSCCDYRPNFTNAKLLRLDTNIYLHNRVDKLTNLTYLKCDCVFTVMPNKLPLLELEAINYYKSDCDYLMKLTRLTKLVLINPSFVTGLENLRVVEFALIDYRYLVNISLNKMTTLTSLTVLHSNADIDKLTLRNLCICQCIHGQHANVASQCVVKCPYAHRRADI